MRPHTCSDLLSAGICRTGRALLLLVLVAMLLPTTPIAAFAEPVRIVVLGDSLTAGFRLPPDAAFPLRLERALKAKGHDVEVQNAGVSGDTSSAGLARVDWAVPDGTDAVIVELGANDALRGLDPALTREALDKLLTRLKAKGATILVAGMQAPRNLGPQYVQAFDSIFPDLARKHDALLYPFFLEGVALRPDLNLDDGIHPNARGVDVIVAGILPKVEELIARVKSRPRQAKGQRG